MTNFVLCPLCMRPTPEDKFVRVWGNPLCRYCRDYQDDPNEPGMFEDWPEDAPTNGGEEDGR